MTNACVSDCFYHEFDSRCTFLCVNHGTVRLTLNSAGSLTNNELYSFFRINMIAFQSENCLRCRRGHPLLLRMLYYFFFLFLFYYPTEIWKQPLSTWNCRPNRICRMVSQNSQFEFQHFSGNLTNDQKTEPFEILARHTALSVRDIESPCSKCCDGKSISLRQRVTLTRCLPRCSVLASIHRW